MSILVLGRSGQLATALAEVASSSTPLRLAGRPELDMAEEGSAAALIEATRPSLVINTAAYTAVDQAEAEPAAAHRINAEAVGEAAAAAHSVGASFVHVSTDYVFDGSAGAPWTEDRPVAPLNSYGRSKLAGEEALRRANPDHLILRTSWLYGATGQNFVLTMLRLAQSRPEVRVVDDQRGCPTEVGDLARALLALAQRRLGGDRAGWGETYHLTGSEACSWAGFAQALFAEAGSLGWPAARVVPIPSADYPTPARRPLYSVLDCSKAERQFGLTLPGFREAVPKLLRRLQG